MSDATTAAATELGAEIAAARVQAGLTLRALGERVGISEGRVRQIEKGYESRGEFQIPVRMTDKTLRGLAQALGECAGPLLRDAAGPMDPPDDDLDALGRGRDDVLPLDGLDDATKAYLRTIAEEARRRNPEAQ